MLCMWKVGPCSQKLLVKEGKRGRNSRDAARVGKRQWRTISFWLASSNTYGILCPEKLGNKVFCQGNTEEVRDVQCTLQLLREVCMKVGLEKLESYEGIVVKALLDSRAMGLFMNTKFAKKKRFKLERLKNPLLV